MNGAAAACCACSSSSYFGCCGRQHWAATQLLRPYVHSAAGGAGHRATARDSSSHKTLVISPHQQLQQQLDQTTDELGSSAGSSSQACAFGNASKHSVEDKRPARSSELRSSTTSSISSITRSSTSTSMRSRDSNLGRCSSYSSRTDKLAVCVEHGSAGHNGDMVSALVQLFHCLLNLASKLNMALQAATMNKWRRSFHLAAAMHHAMFVVQSLQASKLQRCAG